MGLLITGFRGMRKPKTCNYARQLVDSLGVN
jgi:hypothetical protein